MHLSEALQSILCESPQTLVDIYFTDIKKTHAFSDHGSSIEEFIESYEGDPWWDDELDFPEILKDEKFWDGFKTWLGNRVKYVWRTMREDITRSGGWPLQLKRAMFVPNGWNPHQTGLGVFWTLDSSAMAHQGDHSDPFSKEIELTASVSSKSVNWRETIRSRIDYMHGDVENEIQLIPGSKIYLITADDNSLEAGFYKV